MCKTISVTVIVIVIVVVKRKIKKTERGGKNTTFLYLGCVLRVLIANYGQGFSKLRPILKDKLKSKYRQVSLKQRDSMKNILEDFNERELLRCPNPVCGSLQTYHIKKENKMRCRRCGNIFELRPE